MSSPRSLPFALRPGLCALILVLMGCSDPIGETTQGDSTGKISEDAMGGDLDGESALSDAQPSTERACNGHPALCNRPLNQVIFAGTHNAMSNGEEGWLVPNQNFGLKRQLEDGVRAFLIDTYEWSNPKDPSTKLWLCHGDCKLGSIRLIDACKTFSNFLASHPNEVLIWVIEDKPKGAKIAPVLQESGLLSQVHVHTPGTPFLSLGELIDRGERLLITAESGSPPPAWYHHFGTIGFDTPYEFHTMKELQQSGGPKDSCRVFRGKEGAEIFLMNHWVHAVLPTPEGSELANVKEVLLKRARRCQKMHGRLPTIIAVDHYDIGGLLDAVEELNLAP